MGHKIDFASCRMDNSQSVFNEVKKAIEANGTLDHKERDKLLLMAITCVFFEVEAMRKRSRFITDTVVKAVIGTLIALVLAYAWSVLVGP